MTFNALTGLSLINVPTIFAGLARLYKPWITDVTNAGTVNFNEFSVTEITLDLSPHAYI